MIDDDLISILIKGLVLNKTISDAFACSGGGFRLLLPLLLIPTRSHSDFQSLSSFADVIVPRLETLTNARDTKYSGETKNNVASNSLRNNDTTMSSILCETIALLAALLKSDPRNLNLFISRNGIECISWILLRIPSSYITIELWQSCLQLCYSMCDSNELQHMKVHHHRHHNNGEEEEEVGNDNTTNGTTDNNVR